MIVFSKMCVQNVQFTINFASNVIHQNVYNAKETEKTQIVNVPKTQSQKLL